MVPRMGQYAPRFARFQYDNQNKQTSIISRLRQLSFPCKWVMNLKHRSPMSFFTINWDCFCFPSENLTNLANFLDSSNI
jgi:hypothetical protein